MNRDKGSWQLETIYCQQMTRQNLPQTLKIIAG